MGLKAQLSKLSGIILKSFKKPNVGDTGNGLKSDILGQASLGDRTDLVFLNFQVSRYLQSRHL